MRTFALTAIVAVFLVGCSTSTGAPLPEATNRPVSIATLTPTLEPEATPEPTAEPEPTLEPEPTAAAADSTTRAQGNAIEAARSYLDYSAFSLSGLVSQLEYEGYATADAKFAVASLDVNWKEQAYLSAKAYLDYSSFSLSGLISQLEYEGFSHKEAKYGAEKAYK